MSIKEIEYDVTDYTGIKHNEDGVTQIGISSQAKTELGRRLAMEHTSPFDIDNVTYNNSVK